MESKGRYTRRVLFLGYAPGVRCWSKAPLYVPTILWYNSADSTVRKIMAVVPQYLANLTGPKGQIKSRVVAKFVFELKTLFMQGLKFLELSLRFYERFCSLRIIGTSISRHLFRYGGFLIRKILQDIKQVKYLGARSHRQGAYHEHPTGSGRWSGWLGPYTASYEEL